MNMQRYADITIWSREERESELKESRANCGLAVAFDVAVAVAVAAFFC